MIDGLVSGRVIGQPVERISKTDKPYTLAKVRATSGDGDNLIVNVIAFDEAPAAALLALSDGDSVSLAGSLSPKVWIDKDNEPRPSLDMVAHQVLTAYRQIPKRRGIGEDN